MLMDRLQELEGKVREALAILQETRAQKVALEARLQELEGRMESLSDTVRKEQQEKEHLKTSLQRLEAEREEVRSRVDALLEEVARAEGALKERH